MGKELYIFLLLIFISHGNTVWSQQVSDNVEISLLTASPGKELYSVFGHNALRVKDNEKRLDIVFNYGMFNFDAPDFYMNFVKGRMNYCLGTESYVDFIASYTQENRKIREQIFEMDSVQKQYIIQFLERNIKPENKYYLYHFFDDNCATRIRDLIMQTYKGLELTPTNDSLTYRDLVHIYLQHRPWERFGIDIVLGVSADKKTDIYEQMFLPDYLFDAFADTEYKRHPIVKETKTVFTPEQIIEQSSPIITPLFVCWCIFALSLLFCVMKKGAKIFDFILFLLVGIIGIIIMLLWFFTDHTDMQDNFNIIWALPTHVIIAFFILFRLRNRFYGKYFLTTCIVSIVLLITWVLIPQKLNPALIPLIMGISLRALYNSFSNPTSINKFTKLFNFNN